MNMVFKKLVSVAVFQILFLLFYGLILSGLGDIFV